MLEREIQSTQRVGVFISEVDPHVHVSTLALKPDPYVHWDGHGLQCTSHNNFTIVLCQLMTSSHANAVCILALHTLIRYVLLN